MGLYNDQMKLSFKLQMDRIKSRSFVTLYLLYGFLRLQLFVPFCGVPTSGNIFALNRLKSEKQEASNILRCRICGLCGLQCVGLKKCLF